MLCRALFSALAVVMCLSAQAQFTPEERTAVQDYWKKPGRYKVASLKLPTGSWQVRLTVTGSRWLWNYNKVRGLSKGNPSAIPAPQTADQVEWEKWINAKVAFDRFTAGEQARTANQEFSGQPSMNSEPDADDPGPAPKGLVDLAGEPPAFAGMVTPTTYTVNFDDRQYTYIDQVAMRPRYAYFRFSQGVMVAGKPVKQIPQDELNGLLKDAGIQASEGNVMRAVSMLEGGFESINTYDTGYLSVGLIQFATLSGGAGSLGSVLLKMKHDSPDDFRADFRQFGVDVTETGILDVVDPETGDELLGPNAVQRVIDDKRLTAPFQRAGERRPFQIAQIKVAKVNYYPANDAITLNLDGGPISGKICDCIKSEAGVATLMDRKVNTGGLGAVIEILTQAATELGAHSLSELAPYEKDIVAALKYRKDYLADASLSQPAESPVHRAFNHTSRAGTRGKRGGG